MDPTISAAVIGGVALVVSGGWVAIVAIMTSHNATRTNQATIDAAAANTARMLDAAREDRIWDKRAEAYVDAMRHLKHQKATREDKTRMMRYDQVTEQQIREWLDSLRLSDWPEVEMRLLAYSSQRVLDAMRTSGEANDKVEKAYQNWTWLSGEARKAGPDAPAGADVIAAGKAIKPALEEAQRQDDVLLEAIRADLHARPSQEIALPPGS